MNTPLEGKLLLVAGYSLSALGGAMLLVACSSGVERFKEPAPRPERKAARIAPQLRVEPEPLLRCRSQSCIEQCALDNEAKPKWCSSFEPQPKRAQ